jgi:hypothetical protein
MNARNKSKFLLTLICVLLAYSHTLYAQTAYLPSQREAYQMGSGLHAGRASGKYVAFRETVSIPHAPWLRLHFGDVDLGESSFITIISLEDGAKQHLDAESIIHYRGSSAFFNGGAVEVELNIEPGDEGVFFQLKEVTAGEKPQSELTAMQICAVDDRIPSSDPQCGRIVYISGGDTISVGSAYMAINSACVTSGGVAATGNLDIMQFNVPESACNGQIRHPDPSDQYAVGSPITYANLNNYGNNYAVFPCLPNSETGRLPYQAQGPGYRVSHDHTPAYQDDVLVIGYGVDYYPPGCEDLWNLHNHVQQGNADDFFGEVYVGPDNVYFWFYADAESGSQGSPILYQVGGEWLAIGVYTYGNCQSATPPQANYGTSYENNNFAANVNNFLGADVVYLDLDHPAPSENGTVFRPYDTLVEAVTNVPASGAIFLVGGTYTGVTTFSDPMTLIARAGTARIE